MFDRSLVLCPDFDGESSVNTEKSVVSSRRASMTIGRRLNARTTASALRRTVTEHANPSLSVNKFSDDNDSQFNLWDG